MAGIDIDVVIKTFPAIMLFLGVVILLYTNSNPSISNAGLLNAVGLWLIIIPVGVYLIPIIQKNL